MVAAEGRARVPSVAALLDAVLDYGDACRDDALAVERGGDHMTTSAICSARYRVCIRLAMELRP